MPLCRGQLISLKDDKQVWVSFKYERLLNICYWCDWLTHDDRDYKIWIESKGTLRNDQKEFGSSLHASPFVVSKKNTIMVPGYYLVRTQGTSLQLYAYMGGRAKRRRPNLWPHGWSLLVLRLEIKQVRAFNN